MTDETKRLNTPEQREAYWLGYHRRVRAIWAPVFKKLDKALLESYKKFCKNRGIIG